MHQRLDDAGELALLRLLRRPAQCKWNPTLSPLVRKRAGPDTLIAFQGSRWDTIDCGAVTVSALGEKVEFPLKTYNTSSFRGVITVKNGRLCGLDLYARQAPNTERKASFRLGDRLNALVLLAHPGTTLSGEQLFPGDYLCTSEVPPSSVGALNTGKGVTGNDIAGVATKLGVKLLELGGQGWAHMTDTAGHVDIIGESIERASDDLVRKWGEHVLFQPFADVVSGTVQSPSPAWEGYVVSRGSLTVQGDLGCRNCEVFVEGGNLTVTGSITGYGTIIATGNITAAGAALQGRNGFALIAGGIINLP